VNFYRRVVVNSSRDRGRRWSPVDPGCIHVEALDFIEFAN
jgi:hypothetical protein